MTANTLWVQHLAETPLSERGTVLEALVVAEFRTWLLMDATDVLPFDESYFELGLTSLGAVEIEQRLESVLGRSIDSTSLFNNPTIGHLLNHLRTEVLAELFMSIPAPRDSAQTSPDQHVAAPGDRVAATVPATFGASGNSPKDLLNDLLKDLYEA